MSHLHSVKYVDEDITGASAYIAQVENTVGRDIIADAHRSSREADLRTSRLLARFFAEALDKTHPKSPTSTDQ